MSVSTLVLGSPGTGKSTSLRNLDPKTTFIINVIDKPLPFKGYAKVYKPFAGDGKTGNYFSSDNWESLLKVIHFVNDNRPDITTLILDDFNYIMSNEFLRRACETGFTKFSEMAQHAWVIINLLNSLRPDLLSFVMAHNEIDARGFSKMKTIGKMLDEKISIEGMFTVCFHTAIMDDGYKFLTQGNRECTAKSPMGMFRDLYIENDLALIKDCIEEYYYEEDVQS